MRMMRWLAAVSLLLPALALAQEPFIYPAKGQSAQQQDKDKYECYGWAKGQSGFDPMAVPRTTTPPPPDANRSVLGGVVGGGVTGAVVGGVAGAAGGGKKSVGKGARTGGAIGGMLGGMSASGSNQKASQDRKDWERREANIYAQNRERYDRAFGACMEGRGYTVK